DLLLLGERQQHGHGATLQSLGFIERPGICALHGRAVPVNALELRKKAAADAATPKADWLAAHASHDGGPVSQTTGVNGHGQVHALLVWPCGPSYAEVTS